MPGLHTIGAQLPLLNRLLIEALPSSCRGSARMSRNRRLDGEGQLEHVSRFGPCWRHYPQFRVAEGRGRPGVGGGSGRLRLGSVSGPSASVYCPAAEEVVGATCGATTASDTGGDTLQSLGTPMKRIPLWTWGSVTSNGTAARRGLRASASFAHQCLKQPMGYALTRS
jgi:hypothetical protein